MPEEKRDRPWGILPDIRRFLARLIPGYLLLALAAHQEVPSATLVAAEGVEIDQAIRRLHEAAPTISRRQYDEFKYRVERELLGGDLNAAEVYLSRLTAATSMSDGDADVRGLAQVIERRRAAAAAHGILQESPTLAPVALVRARLDQCMDAGNLVCAREALGLLRGRVPASVSESLEQSIDLEVARDRLAMFVPEHPSPYLPSVRATYDSVISAAQCDGTDLPCVELILNVMSRELIDRQMAASVDLLRSGNVPAAEQRIAWVLSLVLPSDDDAAVDALAAMVDLDAITRETLRSIQQGHEPDILARQLVRATRAAARVDELVRETFPVSLGENGILVDARDPLVVSTTGVSGSIASRYDIDLPELPERALATRDIEGAVEEFRRTFENFSLCARVGLSSDPEFSALIEVSFTILRDGSVRHVQVLNADLSGGVLDMKTFDGIVDCVTGAVERWQFRPGDTPVTMDYSFPFN